MAAGTSALLILIGGGATGVATLTGHDEKPRIVTAVGQEAAAPPPPEPAPQQTRPRPRHPAVRPHAAPVQRKLAVKSGGTPVPPRPPAPRTAEKPMPIQTTRTEIETREIPFETRVVRDPKMARGTKRVEIPGAAGEETLRYLVTLTNGQPTDRKLVDATVTKQPQHRVVAVGSKRGCGDTLNFCVPLARSQFCPREADPEDVELLDPDDLTAEWGTLEGCR
jgi:hypothetical protein